MTQLNLLVLYTDQLEACQRFYTSLGLAFTAEQHGSGPEHYAAVLTDGMVLELYPASDERRSGPVRLGFAVPAGQRDPRFPLGLHVLQDPDGRIVEVTVE